QRGHLQRQRISRFHQLHKGVQQRGDFWNSGREQHHHPREQRRSRRELGRSSPKASSPAGRLRARQQQLFHLRLELRGKLALRLLQHFVFIPVCRIQS